MRRGIQVPTLLVPGARPRFCGMKAIDAEKVMVPEGTGIFAVRLSAGLCDFDDLAGRDI
jgi:hypothetical protein